MTKKERRKATALMTKCACGNVARLGTTHCSRCEPEDNLATGDDGELADLFWRIKEKMPFHHEELLGLADRITALSAEVERKDEALRSAVDFLKSAPLESGYCCCGDAVDAHGMGSGHSPVDELAYAANNLWERIEEALGAKP